MSVVLATAGYDHKIRFWEAPSGICSRMIKYPDSQVNRLEITPDKQFIAAAGNPVIRLYEILAPAHVSAAAAAAAVGTSNSSTMDPTQQQAVLTLEGHTNNVTAIGFQRDGRYLYSCSEDGTIKVWDLRNPHYSRSFDVGAPVNSVTLRTDRDEFISGDQNGFVKIWDLGGNGCINSLKPSSGAAAMPVHTSSSSSGDSSGNNSKSSSSGEQPQQQQHQQQQQSATSQHPSEKQRLPTRNGNNQYQPHGASHLALRNRTISTTSNTAVQRRHYFDSEGSAPIQAVDISEDSRTLVAISNHGSVFVWDPSRSGRAPTVPPSKNNMRNQATTTTTSRSTNNNNNINRNENKYHQHDDMGHQHSVPLTSLSTSATSSSTAELAAMPSFLRPVIKFRAHAPGIFCLHGKIAPDCRHLVTTGSDGMAKLWDTTTWELTQTLPNQRWVWDAAFCADSSYLVTASSDHVARLWNLRTGDVVRQYHGHQSAVTCVALNDSSV